MANFSNSIVKWYAVHIELINMKCHNYFPKFTMVNYQRKWHEKEYSDNHSLNMRTYNKFPKNVDDHMLCDSKAPCGLY